MMKADKRPEQDIRDAEQRLELLQSRPALHGSQVAIAARNGPGGIRSPRSPSAAACARSASLLPILILISARRAQREASRSRARIGMRIESRDSGRRGAPPLCSRSYLDLCSPRPAGSQPEPSKDRDEDREQGLGAKRGLHLPAPDLHLDLCSPRPAGSQPELSKDRDEDREQGWGEECPGRPSTSSASERERGRRSGRTKRNRRRGGTK